MARQEATYLPADLYSRVHNHVWLVVGLALGLALVLPKFLLGQYTQLCRVSNNLQSHATKFTDHDGFRRPNSRSTDCVRLWIGRCVEQPGDHRYTSCSLFSKHPPTHVVVCERTVLDIGADRVLFVIDEVLREGVAEVEGY